jgi:FixJ family two-component response regulator
LAGSSHFKCIVYQTQEEASPTLGLATTHRRAIVSPLLRRYLKYVSELSQTFISVVDNDELVRRALKRLLVSLGFTAEVFSSAQDFLNSAHLHNTGCLILDVKMSGMSGLQLQSHLATAGYRIPIIFHTADLNDQVKAQALQDGALAFLQKPAKEQDLLAAIRSALKVCDHD